jgi:hypothetical protein
MHERISWMEGKGWIHIVILLHDIKFKAWEGRETQEVTVFDQWDVVCTYIRDTAWQKSSDVVYWAKDESNTCSDSMMRSALQLDFCFASPPFTYTLFCNNTNPTVYLTAFPIFFFSNRDNQCNVDKLDKLENHLYGWDDTLDDQVNTL